MSILPLLPAPTLTPTTAATSHQQQPVNTKSWFYVSWLFIGLGILFRLYHYIDNRSFWTDEIYLASSLIRMNFVELTSPMLDYEQKAPIGFLWAMKLAVVAFGKNELALRLFPLLCGIAALFVFLPVSRYFLKPFGAAIAMGILALASPIIYHSVEAKQYISELLGTVLCLFLYARYHHDLRPKQLLWWGFWGALVLWFSYASIFVFAGVAFVVSFSHLIKQNWKFLFLVAIPFSMWLISFGAIFFLFINQQNDSGWLLDWFTKRQAFMPFPPTSASDLKWFFDTFYLFLQYPLSLLWNNNEVASQALRILLKMTLLPIGFLALGIWAVGRQSKVMLAVLTLPVMLALVASGLKLYPFHERLMVFIAPLAILLIAAGAQYTAQLLPVKARWKYLIASLILVGPVYYSLLHVVNPILLGGYKHSSHREALLYINERIQPGDVVYIRWNALAEYKLYNELYKFNWNVIVGKDTRPGSAGLKEYFEKLEPDFAQLAKYKRAWVFQNKYLALNIGDYERPGHVFHATVKSKNYMLLTELLFLKEMALRGKRMDTFDELSSSVHLFNLDKI